MTLNKHQWELISQSVINTRQNERVQQQSVYRLFQALIKNDDVLFRRLQEAGVVLDAPLHKNGDSSVPGAEEFFPMDYPFDQITPVGYAAFTDDVDMLMKLYNNGADILFPGATGRDALGLAAWNRSVHAWDWLRDTAMDTGLSIVWNQRSSDGKRTTRLMDAVVRRCVFAVQEIASRVDVSAWDNTGRTALHYNFLQDPYTDVDLQIARILVEYGAPVHVEDHDGVSVAALAVTPEQEALMDNVMLRQVSEEARLRAEDQRNKLKANAPEPERDPSEPQFPQIQKPVKFKRPLM